MLTDRLIIVSKRRWSSTAKTTMTFSDKSLVKFTKRKTEILWIESKRRRMNRAYLSISASRCKKRETLSKRTKFIKLTPSFWLIRS